MFLLVSRWSNLLTQMTTQKDFHRRSLFGCMVLGSSPIILKRDKKHDNIHSTILSNLDPSNTTIIVYVLPFQGSVSGLVTLKDDKIVKFAFLNEKVKSVQFTVVGYSRLTVHVDTKPKSITISVANSKDIIDKLREKLQLASALEKCCQFLNEEQRKTKNLLHDLHENLEDKIKRLKNEATQARFLAVMKLGSLRAQCTEMLGNTPHGNSTDMLLVWAEVQLSKIEAVQVPFKKMLILFNTLKSLNMYTPDEKTAKLIDNVKTHINLLLTLVQDKALDKILDPSEFQLMKRRQLNAKVRAMTLY